MSNQMSEQARKNLVRLMARQIPKYEAAARKEAKKQA